MFRWWLASVEPSYSYKWWVAIVESKRKSTFNTSHIWMFSTDRPKSLSPGHLSLDQFATDNCLALSHTTHLVWPESTHGSRTNAILMTSWNCHDDLRGCNQNDEEHKHHGTSSCQSVSPTPNLPSPPMCRIENSWHCLPTDTNDSYDC